MPTYDFDATSDDHRQAVRRVLDLLAAKYSETGGMEGDPWLAEVTRVSNEVFAAEMDAPLKLIYLIDAFCMVAARPIGTVAWLLKSDHLDVLREIDSNIEERRRQGEEG